MKLIIATKNEKKLKELQEILRDLIQKSKLELLSLSAFPSISEIEEDGAAFEENAVKKALGYANQTGLLTLAEDSGLSVDALDGAPGVYSARFAGPNKSDTDNCLKVLQLMKNIPDVKRGAQFESVVAIASPNQLIGTAYGSVRGMISLELRGNGGFGYDPLFFYPPYNKTLAEVSASDKNLVSHRRQALDKSKPIINKQLMLL